MDIFNIDGLKIRQLRESKGLTREKLSELSNVPPATLADIELNKTKNPGLETMKSILKVLLDNKEFEEAKKADLILSIIARISALNEAELMALDAVIRNSDAFIDGGSFVVSSTPNHYKTR